MLRLPWRRAGRVRGYPTSGNRASSFHLWWQLPASEPLIEASAVIEIRRPPAVPELYFWALQVGFAERGRALGAGHTGLQWTPDAPEGAVNWGGYGPDGRELDGSSSAWPGVGTVNTVHWPWQPGHPYRFRVYSPRAGRWRSEVSDLTDGRVTAIRDLFVEAGELSAPVVWTEAFARCDAPATEARWSQLQAVDRSGTILRPSAVTVTYQSHADGGCANTDVEVDGDAVVQRTGLDEARHGGTGQLLRL